MTNNSKPILPNFMIVGAAKGGTTALYYYLKSHPEIFLSQIKEPCYISSQFLDLPQKGVGDEKKHFTRTYEGYCKLFEKAEGFKAVGEASVDNLYYYPQTIPLIKQVLGDPKIIIVLRNPVDRAYSSFLFQVRDNREFLSFEEALEQEEERIKNNWQSMWHYKVRGMYYNQVKAFLESFSHVKVLIYDDFKKNPMDVVKQVYEFLGVDSSFHPPASHTKFNVSGFPKYKMLNNLFIMKNFAQRTVRNIGRFILTEDGWAGFRDSMREKLLYKPEMKPETRVFLRNEYHDEVLRLQELLGRDLSSWLSPERMKTGS